MSDEELAYNYTENRVKSLQYLHTFIECDKTKDVQAI